MKVPVQRFGKWSSGDKMKTKFNRFETSVGVD